MATVTYDPKQAKNYYDAEWCCGKELTIEIQHSAAGYYIGTFCQSCGPTSRHSNEYFRTHEQAEQAHMTGNYSPKF
jgi:hypothetical protein